jgi:hypothetical protein
VGGATQKTNLVIQDTLFYFVLLAKDPKASHNPQRKFEILMRADALFERKSELDLDKSMGVYNRGISIYEDHKGKFLLLRQDP